MPDLTGAGVRVLLVGTAERAAAADLPVVRRSFEAVRTALLQRCGLPAAHLVALLDPVDTASVRTALARCADEADVLLVHWIGPGLIGPDGEAYLAVTSTADLDPGRASYQAVSVASITETVRNRASYSVVIVDAVVDADDAADRFASRAGERLAGAGFVLVTASAPGEAEFTASTGALVDLLDRGDPRGPTRLTVADSYVFLRRQLNRAGLVVHHRAHDDSGRLELTDNRAWPERPGQPPLPGRCPWPGLASFDPDDADHFFGRDDVSDDLVGRMPAAMAASSPLVLVGPSGIGKTSLVRAGLPAKLQSGRTAARTALWRTVFVTLGTGGETLEQQAGQLAARVRPGGGTLVVVDQLEQLFTRDRPQADVAAFLTVLVELAARPSVAVVLALRADHFARAGEYPQLVPALQEHQVLIGAIDRNGLREAIEKPAAAAGLELEAGLSDYLLDELVATDSRATTYAVLPMLSHTLQLMWLRRDGARLTRATYRTTGGIAVAVRTSAEEVYARLSPEQQAGARRILPRLVRIDDELAFTARSVPIEDLIRGEPEQHARPMLEAFAHSRLITLDQQVARFAHEVLIGSWDRLIGWVRADQDWLRLRQQLDRDARAWQQAGRDRSRLYRGERLARVGRALDKPGRTDEMSPEAAHFVASSDRFEKRAARVRPTLIGVLIALLVVSVLTATTIVVLGARTAAQRDTVAAETLINEADRIRSADPGLAKQLDLIAYRIDPEKGEAGLVATLGRPGMFSSDQVVVDLARAADGHLLVFSAIDRFLLQDAAGHLLSTVTDLTTGSVALGSARHVLAAGTGAPRTMNRRTHLRLWDVTDPRRPAPLADVPAGPGDLLSVALSPDEQVLATAAADGTIVLWDVSDLRTPRRLHTWRPTRAAVHTVIFAASGRTLISTGEDARTRIWDVSTPGRPRLRWSLRTSAQIPDVRLGPVSTMIQRRLDVDPTGRYLLAVTSAPDTATSKVRAESPQVWDLTAPGAPQPIADHRDDLGCAHSIRGAVWLKSLIVTSCASDPEVFSFDPQREPTRRIETVTHYASGRDLELSAGDGGPLLAADPGLYSADGRGVLVWPITTGYQPGAAAGIRSGSGFLPVDLLIDRAADGRDVLLENGELGLTRVWDLADRRLLATHKVFQSDGIGFEQIARAGGLASSPARQLFAVTEMDQHRPRVAVYSTAAPTAAALGTITDLRTGALELAFNRDGTVLAVVDNAADTRVEPSEPGITLYDVRNPARPVVITRLPANVTDLAYSRDGLLAGFGQGQVRLWDVSDPRRPVSLPDQQGKSGTATSGSFAPDGTRFVLNDGQSTRLWPVRNRRLGAAAVSLPRSYGLLATATFGADSATLVAAGENTRSSQLDVDLWDVQDVTAPVRRAGWTYADTIAPGRPVAIDRSGRTVLVKGNNVLLIWDLDPAALRSSACRSSGRVITRAEWDRYVRVRRYAPPCEQAGA